MLISGFILGLVGSLHCVGMCGPIAFMLPVDRNHQLKKATQISIYHTGRLLAYVFIGLLFGLLGRSLYLFGIQQQLSIAVGIVLIIAVLAPWLLPKGGSVARWYQKLLFKIKSKMGKLFKSRSMDAFLSMGFLNGLLPCGLVYMGVLGSLAMESLTNSVLYMLLFGAGTIPLMTATVYLGNFLNAATRRKFKRAVPIVLVIIGTLFIIRGLGLGIPYLSPEPVGPMASGVINCH